MTLLRHQHEALVEELKRPEFDNLSADEVFQAFQNSPYMKRLAATIFMTRTKFERLHPKRRPKKVIFVEADNLPGFPNKLKREWFDAAWKEIRDG